MAEFTNVKAITKFNAAMQGLKFWVEVFIPTTDDSSLHLNEEPLHSRNATKGGKPSSPSQCMLFVCQNVCHHDF